MSEFDDEQLPDDNSEAKEKAHSESRRSLRERKTRIELKVVRRACDFCRIRKARCSGNPCDRCVKARRRCVFSASHHAPNSHSEDGESHNGGGSPPIESPGRLAEEILLADISSATFLMHIFTSRVLPFNSLTHCLPEPSSFLASLRQPRSMTAAMQRDGALALACRNCGHEPLARKLIARMDGVAEILEQQWKQNFHYADNDTISCFVLLFMLAASDSAQKGFKISETIFAMHRSMMQRQRQIQAAEELYEKEQEQMVDGEDTDMKSLLNNDVSSCTSDGSFDYHVLAGPVGGGGDKAVTAFIDDNYDPVEALCAPLQNLDLTQDPFQDGFDPVEVKAFVEYSAKQLATWSTTMPDIRLRMFVKYMIEWRTRLVDPRLRPVSSMLFSLTVDMQLLGLCIPPYLEEVMTRHDPEGRFGLNAFRNLDVPPEQLLEPPTLPQEIASVLLRRVRMARYLLYIAHVPAEIAVSHIVLLETLHAIIHLRGGNISEAADTVNRALQYTVSYDLNFWPPLVTQCMFVAVSIFYEARQPEGMDRIIAILQQVQRSNPFAAGAMAAVMELRDRLTGGDGGGGGGAAAAAAAAN